MATSTDPEPCLPVGIPGLIRVTRDDWLEGTTYKAALHAKTGGYRLYINGEWVYTASNPNALGYLNPDRLEPK